MKIRLTSDRQSETVKLLANAFNTHFEVIDDSTMLVVPEQFGIGHIQGLEFDGLGLLFIDCTFNYYVSFDYEYSGCGPLKFVYCREGEFDYALNPGGENIHLQKQGMSLIGAKKGKRHELHFEPRVQMKCTIVSVHREEYMTKAKSLVNTLPSLLKDAFTDVHCKGHFIHQDRYGFEIADTLRSMAQNNYRGMSGKVYLESKLLELLYRQIEEYRDVHEGHPDDNEELSRANVEQIKHVRDIMLADLSKDYSIRELSVKAGMNSTKLKKEFKAVYKKTIKRYLREERMKYAYFLLKEPDMTIKEVAAQVGYTNQSHFTRRFKEKYGVLPKEYMKQHGQ